MIFTFAAVQSFLTLCRWFVISNPKWDLYICTFLCFCILDRYGSLHPHSPVCFFSPLLILKEKLVVKLCRILVVISDSCRHALVIVLCVWEGECCFHLESFHVPAKGGTRGSLAKMFVIQWLGSEQAKTLSYLLLVLLVTGWNSLTRYSTQDIVHCSHRRRHRFLTKVAVDLRFLVSSCSFSWVLARSLAGVDYVAGIFEGYVVLSVPLQQAHSSVSHFYSIGGVPLYRELSGGFCLLFFSKSLWVF